VVYVPSTPGLLFDITDRTNQAHRIHPPNVVTRGVGMDSRESVRVVVVEVLITRWSRHVQILGESPGLVFPGVPGATAPRAPTTFRVADLLLGTLEER